MKKSIIIFTLLFIVVKFGYSQSKPLDSTALAQKPTFRSLLEAFKNPLEVYKLYISQAELDELPKRIVEFKNLQVLYCWGNNLKKLPPEIGQLKNLTEISCGSNPLTTLPDEIADLPYLRKISCNEASDFTTIPIALSKSKSLEILAFAGCNISQLPKEIGQIKNLKELSLQYNQLSQLSKEIGNLQNLSLLELHHNQLTNLPQELGKLKQLKKLDISDNQLVNFPSMIFKLENLEILTYQNNKLRDIPKDIKKLKNLTHLILNDNEIAVLPKEIAELKKLKFLFTEKNNLTEIPAEIRAMKDLNKEKILTRQKVEVPSQSYEKMSYNDLIDQVKPLFQSKKIEEAFKVIALAQKKALQEFGKKSKEYASALMFEAILSGYVGQTDRLTQRMSELQTMFEKNEIADAENYIKFLGELKSIYEEKNEIKEAEKIALFLQKVQAKHYGEKSTEYAGKLEVLAYFYRKNKMPEKAETLYLQANEIYKTSDKNMEERHLMMLVSLGKCYLEQKKYAQAEPSLLIVKPIWQKENVERIKEGIAKPYGKYIDLLKNLAAAYFYQEKKEEAIACYQELVNILGKISKKDSPDYTNNVETLLNLLDKESQYAQAIPYIEELKNTTAEIYGKEHPKYVRLLNYLAFLYDMSDKPNQAETLYYEESAYILKQISEKSPSLSEKEKEKFYAEFSSNFDFYNSFTMRYYEQKPQLLAWLYNTQLATKSLLFQTSVRMRKRIMEGSDENLKKLFQDWQTKKEQINKSYQMTNEERNSQNIDLKKLEMEAIDLEKQLNLKSELFAQVNDKKNYTWQDVKKSLKKGEAAIEISRVEKWHQQVNEGVYYLALIVKSDTENQPEIVIIESGNIFENTLEDKFLKRYNNKIRYKSTDKDSYPAYWQPIADKLKGIKKVYLSPDGVYNQINLNSLLNPQTNQFLIDELDIQLVSNTKETIKINPKTDKKNVKGATLIGFPDYNNEIKGNGNDQPKERNTDLQKLLQTAKKNEAQRFLSGDNISELPGTKIEVENLEGIFRKKGIAIQKYLAQQASEDLIKSLQSPQILHIATHGFFLQDLILPSQNERSFAGLNQQRIFENPLLRAGLLFAGAKNAFSPLAPKGGTGQGLEDGVLTAYEAMNLNLDNTDLVVMSACETGLGEVKNGEGVYGLQRAFQTAGAKSVLMSLWTVSDEATQQLMTLFYENWITKQKPKRQAFSEAQKQLRVKFPEPYYWGAFVMVGE